MGAKDPILLDDASQELLGSLSSELGRSPADVLRDALRVYASRARDIENDDDVPDWKERIMSACGIWADRDDLPDFEALRRESDRRLDELEHRE